MLHKGVHKGHEGHKDYLKHPDFKYIKSRHLPLENYIDRLRNNRYFAFTRYGDGEWNAILGIGKMAGRAQKNTEEFRRDSRETFLSYAGYPGIIFGMQNNIMRSRETRPPILAFLKKRSLRYHWVNADVFHYASRDGKLAPLIQAMREKKVVVIGPGFLRDLRKQAFQYKKFIEVVPKNCYSQKQEVVNAILATQKELGCGVFYSFSVGPSAEVFIPLLFKKAPQNFFIDFGSIWDIFCGRRTRKYTENKKSYSKEILRKNLGLR